MGMISFSNYELPRRHRHTLLIYLIILSTYICQCFIYELGICIHTSMKEFPTYRSFFKEIFFMFQL